MRNLSIALNHEPTTNDILAVETTVINAEANGFIKHVPVIGKKILQDHIYPLYYITIQCEECDYSFWYGYYWGVRMGRGAI